MGWSSPAGSGGDDTTDDNNSRDLPEGRTGWNHNPPSEKSGFWESQTPNDNDNAFPTPNGEGKEQEDASSGSDDDGDGAMRTGWLHNSEPTPQAKAINQKQKQQTNKARQRLQQAMKEQEQNHRMVSPPSFHACGEGRCLVVTEHLLSVPIYRNLPRSPRIDLFFSIVERTTEETTAWLQGLIPLSPSQRAKEYIQRSGLANAGDMALYLQGGPGFGSPTPMVSLGFSSGSSWAASALDHYGHVVLMDQRGTGRSTAITKQTLEVKFPDLFLLDGRDDESSAKSLQDFVSSNPVEAAKIQKAVDETTEYMAQFRADNIVLDAEEIKDALMVPTEEPVTVRSTRETYEPVIGSSSVLRA